LRAKLQSKSGSSRFPVNWLLAAPSKYPSAIMSSPFQHLQDPSSQDDPLFNILENDNDDGDYSSTRSAGSLLSNEGAYTKAEAAPTYLFIAETSCRALFARGHKVCARPKGSIPAWNSCCALSSNSCCECPPQLQQQNQISICCWKRSLNASSKTVSHCKLCTPCIAQNLHPGKGQQVDRLIGLHRGNVNLSLPIVLLHFECKL